MTGLGDKIRSLRLARKMTLAQLASKTSVTAVTIHNIEHNAFEPKVNTILELSDALEVPIQHLIDPQEVELFQLVRTFSSRQRPSPRKLRQKNLPNFSRIELKSGLEKQLQSAPGILLSLHLVFGRVDILSSEKSASLITGDTLHLELFNSATISARENSLIISVSSFRERLSNRRKS